MIYYRLKGIAKKNVKSMNISMFSMFLKDFNKISKLRKIDIMINNLYQNKIKKNITNDKSLNL